MGGGDSKIYQNTAGSESGKDRTYPLFPNDIGMEYPMTRQSMGFPQAEYASENNPDPYLGETNQDESTSNIFLLFIAMCYMLIEKFREVKNKKLIEFLNKLIAMNTINKESLINTPEFKIFQKYCKNKSIQQYYGYEVIRRFMTKYFSDSSGVFMRLRMDEWKQYVSRFLKDNNFRR
jgi:hypothetical protein